MEEIWDERDEYSILDYINENNEKETIAILNIYEETPDEIRGIEYPFNKNSIPFRLGLKKEREVEYGIPLEQIGSWKCVGKLSLDEIKEKDKILKDRKPKAKENLEDKL